MRSGHDHVAKELPQLMTVEGLSYRLRALLVRPSVVPVLLVGVLLGLVCLRSWTFMFFAHSHLDSDQAVFGLMGKDIEFGRAYPLFMYGQKYMFEGGSWLCAPLFALFGRSVTTLKFPMFAMNIGCVLMLWRGLRRERWLGPWGTALAILPFAATSVVTASRLVEHQGGNIEPIFFVLLAWTVREHAIALGITVAVAFLNREFALIGLIAMVIMDALSGQLLVRRRHYAITLGIAASIVTLVRIVARDMVGYTGSGAILEFQNPLTGLGVSGFFGRQVPVILGAVRNTLRSFNITSDLEAGHDWLICLIIAWAVLAAVGASKLKRSDLTGVSCYLWLVGIGQAAAFILLCNDPPNTMLVRYALMSLCAWIGLTALGWKWQAPALRGALALVVIVVSVANVRDHVLLAREYLRNPPQHENEALANALMDKGIHYLVANFWIAYDVSWLTDEQIIASPPRGQSDRVTRYHDILLEHADEVYKLSDKACKREIPVLHWHLCKVPRRKL
jgi:hypothetical protein